MKTTLSAALICLFLSAPALARPLDPAPLDASQFNLVEVDTSYYAIPAVTTAQHWAERTPPGFVFNVKAFSLFTGQWTSTDVLPKDIKEALGPGRRMVYKDSQVSSRAV